MDNHLHRVYLLLILNFQRPQDAWLSPKGQSWGLGGYPSTSVLVGAIRPKLQNMYMFALLANLHLILWVQEDYLWKIHCEKSSWLIAVWMLLNAAANGLPSTKAWLTFMCMDILKRPFSSTYFPQPTHGTVLYVWSLVPWGLVRTGRVIDNPPTEWLKNKSNQSDWGLNFPGVYFSHFSIFQQSQKHSDRKFCSP